ncbi:helix-turn-helix domain-containing protein [Paracoccus subflavus]|uniref:Helix-turn-helix domain-containing protein n=1 Tax=Paracoccus subflavus TaxID=2528244 RepID=A0A4Q9FX23_9RHOB|nr:helix-turn-helix domain-containing protein [Paracoccus subflavus]
MPQDNLPDDARLYLRHVEQGQSIRALARAEGCHASTILRRIRRFEARRDDPLVDGALTEGTERRGILDDRQAMRLLRRLAEPGAVLVTAEGMDRAIISRDDIRTAVLDRWIAELMALNGWVLPSAAPGRVQRYAIAPAGREALRRMLRSPRQRKAVPGPADFTDARPVANDNDLGMAEAAAGFDHAEKHRVWDSRIVPDPEDGRRRRRARVNIAESPLLLLARRRDNDGTPFLTPGMVGAGERLREDFELAQMGPRVTQNWTGFMTSGIDVSRSGGGYRGGSESARDRVAVALRDLGPGMGDIVLRVCCFLEGIEMTERRLGWSARSGKIVLRLALMRLERHYQETYGSGSRLIG